MCPLLRVSSKYQWWFSVVGGSGYVEEDLAKLR